MDRNRTVQTRNWLELLLKQVGSEIWTRWTITGMDRYPTELAKNYLEMARNRWKPVQTANNPANQRLDFVGSIYNFLKIKKMDGSRVKST